MADVSVLVKGTRVRLAAAPDNEGEVRDVLDADDYRHFDDGTPVIQARLDGGLVLDCHHSALEVVAPVWPEDLIPEPTHEATCASWGDNWHPVVAVNGECVAVDHGGAFDWLTRNANGFQLRRRIVSRWSVGTPHMAHPAWITAQRV